MTLKLKKPAKDHRGEWDLVLDNDGYTIAGLRLQRTPRLVIIMWPQPAYYRPPPNNFVCEWQTHTQSFKAACAFLKLLGVDPAPLRALRDSKAK